MKSNVRIQLVDTNTGYLDLSEETDVPITYSLSDIKDITSRKGTFSKTIKLPGTKNNNKLLNNYFDVNVQAGTFDRNKLQKCIVLVDNVPVLQQGFLQLVSVKKLQTTAQHDQMVEYSVLVKDAVSDFYSKLGSKELTALDFSGYDHLLTAANIVSTFGNTASDVYKYHLTKNFFNSGPTASYPNSYVYEIKDFAPAIFAKQYWDRIFQSAGFQYDWADLGDTFTRFDKLLIPWNGDLSTQPLSTSALVEVEAVGSTPSTPITTPYYTGSFNEIRPFVVDTIISDPSGAYNTTTGAYTSPVNSPSSTIYEVTLDYELVLDNPGSSDYYFVPREVGYTIDPSTGLIAVNMQHTLHLDSSISIYNGSTLLGSNYLFYNDFVNQTYTVSGGSIPFLGGYAPGETTILTSTVSFNISAVGPINAGDILDANINLYSFTVGGFSTNGSGTGYINSLGTGGLAVRYKIKVNNVSLKIVPSSVTYGLNAPVDLNNFVPTQIKQSDFIKSITTMYNLYIDSDASQPNKLIIKKRDAFYDSGAIKDWTKKLNKDKEQILDLAQDSSKKTILTYKQDSDPENKVYLEATKEVYGQQEFTYSSEFLKGIEKKEVIFSPTPILPTNFGAFVPAISGGSPKNNIRILYAGDVYNCNPYVIDYGVGATVVSTYPLVSHFDHTTTPSFDINFGVCDYYFGIGGLTLTNNNLYNLNWRRTLNQIDSSKVLTAYFRLTPGDIASMKLNDKIRIDNSWWNIIKISDYNPSKNPFTKVELISIDNELAIFPVKTKEPAIIKPTDPIFGNIYNAEKEKFKTSNVLSGTLVPEGRNNTVTSINIGGSVTGNKNYINAQYVDIQGNNNFINDSSTVRGNNNQVNSKSYIVGNNNYVAPGLNYVVIIGDNQTVVRDGIYNAYDSPYFDRYNRTNFIIAGRDVVLDPFSNEVPNLISGSVDAVRNLGSYTTISLIASSTDDVL